MTIDEATGFRVLPHWLAQPYWRPTKPAVTAGEFYVFFFDYPDLWSVPAKRTIDGATDVESGKEDGREASKKIKLDSDSGVHAPMEPSVSTMPVAPMHVVAI